MEVEFACPESADLTALQNAYPDLYHDDTFDGYQHWWIGKSGEEYWDSDREGYNYEEDSDDGELCDDRDFDREWMTREECVEFCGFAETLIPDSTTMLEGNGGWAQGHLRSEPEFAKGVARAEEMLKGGANE